MFSCSPSREEEVFAATEPERQDRGQIGDRTEDEVPGPSVGLASPWSESQVRKRTGEGKKEGTGGFR